MEIQNNESELIRQLNFRNSQLETLIKILKSEKDVLKKKLDQYNIRNARVDFYSASSWTKKD